jgi:hypothetical protein
LRGLLPGPPSDPSSARVDETFGVPFTTCSQ